MKYKDSRTYDLVPISGNTQPSSIQATSSQKPTSSRADRLRDLKQLFDEKLISQEEYENERKKILDEEW